MKLAILNGTDPKGVDITVDVPEDCYMEDECNESGEEDVNEAAVFFYGLVQPQAIRRHQLEQD